MALRFLAVVRRQPQTFALPDALRFADLGVTQVVASERFDLWTSAERDLVSTPSGRIHIVGRLYERGHSPGRVLQLNDEIDRQRDVAPFLNERFWGQYVAFSLSSLGAFQIFRDPGGALPCYLHVTPKHVVLFSDIGLAVDSGLVAPAIDWPEIVACLAWPGLRPMRTALEGVDELPQGFALGLAGQHFAELREVWSPWRFVRPSGLSDEALHSALRGTICGTIAALRGEFGRVHLALSGGLDSSVVAACLGGTDTLCLNLVADGPEGDERGYAEAAADSAGLRIFAERNRLDLVNLGRSSAEHLPRPTGSASRLAFDRQNLDFAARHGTQALFSGHGGDNVFCHIRSATPIADCLLTRGSRLRAWRTALDVCRLTGGDLPTAFRRAVRKLPRAAASCQWKPELRLLSQNAVATLADRPTHPWLSAPEAALPGKAAHIAMLMRPQNYAEGPPRGAGLELINPLLSQPIVELCLSIPTWRWIEGGRDRAPVRAAFTPALPSMLVGRTAKGGPDQFYRQIVETRRDEIRERLLDGALIRHDVLDTGEVARVLATHAGDRDFPYLRILDLVDAEAWVRRWSL